MDPVTAVAGAAEAGLGAIPTPTAAAAYQQAAVPAWVGWVGVGCMAAGALLVLTVQLKRMMAGVVQDLKTWTPFKIGGLGGILP